MNTANTPTHKQKGVVFLIRDHRGLEAWQMAHRLALDVYKTTRKFPREELYGLTSQLRRAAVAIPTNLAEGGARQSRREYLQYCYIARGSASEIAYLLLISNGLGFLPQEDFTRTDEAYNRISRMLTALIKSLRST